MPKARKRQRVVFCDCFDCIDRPGPSISSASELTAAEAVARQLPPPKAVILYGSGFVQQHEGISNVDSSTFPHLDCIARDGCLSQLALKKWSEVQGAHRVSMGLGELAQILGVSQAMLEQGTDEVKLPSLAKRFKGMSALFASTSCEAEALGQAVGMSLSPELDLKRPQGCSGMDVQVEAGPSGGAGADNGSLLPLPQDYAEKIISELGENPRLVRALGARIFCMEQSLSADPDSFTRHKGFNMLYDAATGVAEGSSGHDLMLLHLDVNDLAASTALTTGVDPGGVDPVAGPPPHGQGEADQMYNAGLEGMEWLDALVKALLQRPGVREQVLLVLVLSSQGQQLLAPAAQATDPAAAAGGSGQHSDGMQRAAEAAGIAVTAEARGRATQALMGDMMQPGGAELDPGAFVVTPRSAMMAMAATSGAAAAFGAEDEVPCATVHRPVQSWQKSGQETVEVVQGAPVLVAQRLPGVIRRDRCERLGLQECHSRSGQGCMLADRMLWEVAYKLGRAGKYGA